MNSNKKACEVCGKTEGKIERSGITNQISCGKHYQQVWKYGHIKEKENIKKVCEICGDDYRVSKNQFTKQLLCNKHSVRTSKQYKNTLADTIPCEVCGSKYNVHKWEQLNKHLCANHYYQFKKHGKFLDRTIFDKNKIIIHEDKNYAEIELYDKNCDVVGCALIDIEDVEKVKEYKWRLTKNGYVDTSINGEYIKLYRFLLNIYDSHVLIDHKSGDKLDNRKNNLRTCNHSKNAMNANLRSDNTSGVTGVSFEKRSGKWNAYLQLNGKKKSLGSYIDFEDAVKARKAGEEKYFGEFSYDNSRKSSEQTG